MKVCMGEEEFDSRLMLSMLTGAHVRQENSVVHIPLCNSLTRQVIMKKKTVNKSLHYEPQDFWLKNVALK